MKNILTAVLIMAVSAMALVFAGGAWAAVTTMGNVDPVDPATWTSSTDSYVGYLTNGTMEVNDGSTILSNTSNIGRYGGVTGSVTVTGTGSAWTNYSVMRIGYYGTGTLNIADGGAISNENNSLIAVYGGSTGTVIVDNGTWTNTYDLHVGSLGDGTLIIQNGGTMSDRTGTIANFSGSTGAATVTGVGSTWTNTGGLSVGYGGSGTLIITDGGTAINSMGLIGGLANSTGTATVTGAGSQWNNSGNLYVGSYGTGTLTIENGGAVSNANGYIGRDTDAVGTATVTGSGSTWTNDYLTIGDYGTGTLNILNGGIVTSDGVTMGANTIGVGTVTVDGVGSQWITDTSGWSWLYVGAFGNGTLTISNGGVVNSATSVIGDYTGSGTVTVTGSDSQWTNSSELVVGYAGGTGDITIADGGSVSSTDSIIGDDGGIGTVTVTGVGSIWTNNRLRIGYEGTGTLNILSGGNVTSDGVDIGANYTGVGTVTVDGSGSTWTNDYLYVGDSVNGTLTISNGGIVNSARSVIGNYEGSGAVIVTGSGSQWINSGMLDVAYEGGTGDLTIADGGVVSSEDSFIADDGGIGTVTVTGTGSTWTISGELLVGDHDYDGSGTLNISSGAEVIGVNAVIDSMSTLSGDSRLTLNSGNGILTNHGIIAPGNSIGTLTVDGDVVFEDGSTLEAEIDNAGNADKLAVTGDVTINSGSTVAVNSNGETITDGKQYTLIEASSITGEFTTLDTALVTWDAAVESYEMSYDSTTAALVIGVSSVTPFDDLSLLHTYNQRACGRVVEQISNDGGTLDGIMAALQGIVGDDNLRYAFDQLSGQTRPSIAPIVDAGVSGFASTVLGRMHNPQTGTLGTSSQYYPDSKHYFWITGFGLYGERDGNEGVNGSDYDTGGLATGLDHQVTENFRVGITLGWSDTDVDYDDIRDNSSIESFYSGLYANYKYLNGYIDGMFIYADLDSETDRYVDFVGDKNEGDFDGYEVLASVEAARNYYFKDILVQPLLGFELSYQHQDSYTETGGSSALHYDEQSFESYKSSLGVKASKYFYNNDQQSLWGQLQAKWTHEFGDASTDIEVSFASTPSYRFSIKDAKRDRDSAILNTGLKYAPNKSTVLFVDYDAHLNSDTVAHVLSGGIRLAF